jgi:hypothetical protein
MRETITEVARREYSRGRAVSGMKSLRSLERWDRGFESHCVYSVFVLYCV